MPTTEASSASKLTPKSSVKQLDLALLDNASVRDKIKQWQSVGSAVLPKLDEAKVGEAFKKEIEQVRAASSSSQSRSQSAGPQIRIAEPPSTPVKEQREEHTPATDPVKPRVVERQPKPNRLDADLKNASAPKKRVVSDGHWVRKHEEPEDKEQDVQGAWVRKHAKPEEKKPEPQYGWIRDPVLPRNPPDPPSPPKPKDIKVYAARARKKSFATPEQSGNSSDEVRKSPSPVRKTTTPKKSPAKVVEVSPRKAPREKISDWARNISPPSESIMADKDIDEPTPPTHRSSRNRRAAEAPSYYKEMPPSPEARRKSISERQPSSPEANAKPSNRSSRRQVSAEELSVRPKSTRRRGGFQQSPEQIEVDDFRRIRQSSHRRGKSVGAPLTDRTQERHYDEAEEAYVYAGKRKASYREEFEKYAPTERYSPPDRRTNAYRKSRIAEHYENRPPTEIPPPIEPLPPGTFGSRVEAWLSGTPDPFTDAGSEASKSRRTVSYEDKSTRRSPSTLDTASRQLDDPFDMSRSSRTGSRGLRVDTNRTRLSRDRQHVLSPEQSDVTLDEDIVEVEYSSATSVPSSLKRRGATRNSPTPTKERAESPSHADSNLQSEVASSAVSSSVDASKFVPPDTPARHSANAAGRRVPFEGKRLSTIVSVDTLNTKLQQAPSVTETGSRASESTTRPPRDNGSDTITRLTANDEPSVVSTTTKSRTSLKRKLTKHSDLMSVLSMDAPPKSKSIVSARSIRTHRSRLETATISDLMKEVASDEKKYMRELKTLADGVILILLKCVLSKSDAALAAGLYSKAPSKDDVANATKLIRELGVALNRLKTLHGRIPTDDADKFLNWAQSANKIYADYVKTWRMGFEDVVVSLSTTDDGKSSVSEAKSVHGASWDDGLPRNEDGYVIDGDGIRVDVAFLLKRPLVRLKYLNKTVKGINFLKPSTKAGNLQKTFEELMDLAKKRVNEEKARMEDESAANIDASRTRDLKSLAPISGVKVSREKCVRARDYFDLHLEHTSGQMVDCRVELLLRDDAPGVGDKGDLLVCEVDNNSRWLFLPPITLDRLSARKGDVVGEIVVMVRGLSSDGTEWQELLTLYNLDEDVAYEWIQMLGTEPVPPKVEALKSAKSTPMERPASSYISSSYLSDRTCSTIPQKSRTPSPREIDIPIGEKAGSKSKRWTYSSPEPEYAYEKQQTSPITPPTSESEYRVRLKQPEPKKSSEPEKAPSRWTTFKEKFASRKDDSTRSPSSPRTDGDRTPRDLNEAMDLAGSGLPGLKRTKATRHRSSPKSSPAADDSPIRGGGDDYRLSEPTESGLSTSSPRKLSRRPKEELKRENTIKSGFSVWMPPSRTGSDENSDEDDNSSHFSASSTRPVLSQRPIFERRPSFIPSSEGPTVLKVRNGSLPTTPISPAMPTKISSRIHTDQAPASAPSKLQKRPPVDFSLPPKTPEDDRPPPPPPHRTPSSTQTPTKSSQNTPQFTPTSQLKRRSSSPLKHEYQPSSASASDLGSDSASDRSDDDSLTSDSEDDLDDDDDVMSYLAPSMVPKSKPAPPAHMSSQKLSTIPEATINPGDSASQIHAQEPYRQVPQPSSPAVAGPTTKMIASIFGWSDTGGWQQLHPDECSVVISPGLISAYEMSAAHNSNSTTTLRPLIALELTPHVVTRRGTGLDISIRSPITSNSKLKVPSSNVMFRSRSPEECEAFYHYMWQAKLNNPTYIALESGRPKPTQGMWSEAMDRRTSGGEDSEGKKWYHFGESKSKSYRASTRATSTSGNTDSSVRTISSVMNAMKRFSGIQAGSRILSNSFNGRDKTSSGSSGDGSRTPPDFVDPSKGAIGPESLGITNAKIRLYVRETRGKWMDLGTARLSVLQKKERNPDTMSEAGVDAPIALRTGSEKRIIVNTKGGGEVLLDATLGEACFERVARTGIAVSVWEDVDLRGGVAAKGGVAEKRVRIYMIQVCVVLHL